MDCPTLEEQRCTIHDVHESLGGESRSKRTTTSRHPLCGRPADAGTAQVDRTHGGASGGGLAELAAIGHQQSVECCRLVDDDPPGSDSAPGAVGSLGGG